MENKKNSKNSFPVCVSSSKFHLRPCFCYLFWRSKGTKATERQMRVQGTRKLDNVIEVFLGMCCHISSTNAVLQRQCTENQRIISYYVNLHKF